jgi:hypothetical protein
MVDAKAGSSLQPQQTHLVKAKTRKGKRYLEKRGPKLVSLCFCSLSGSLFLHVPSCTQQLCYQYPGWALLSRVRASRLLRSMLTSCHFLPLCQVEDTKRALFLYGNDVSQTVKEAMTDLHKLKGVSEVQLAQSNCCSKE